MQAEFVYLSNVLCESCGPKDTADCNATRPSTVVLDRLGIKPDHYELIADKVSAWMNQLSETLSFN